MTKYWLSFESRTLLSQLGCFGKYSSFIEINLLQNGTTNKKIVTYCKSQFSRHGVPDKLITDNGPQFSSTIFK